MSWSLPASGMETKIMLYIFHSWFVVFGLMNQAAESTKKLLITHMLIVDCLTAKNNNFLLGATVQKIDSHFIFFPVFLIYTDQLKLITVHLFFQQYC